MPDIQKVSIALTSEQVNALKSAVDTGEYATQSEIMREALREWQRKRALRGEDLDRLRALWREGKGSGKATTMGLTELRTQARQKLKKATK